MFSNLMLKRKYKGRIKENENWFLNSEILSFPFTISSDINVMKTANNEVANKIIGK